MSQTPEYEESERTILWDQPEYTASIHEAKLSEEVTMTFFHLDVFYLDHKILKEMRQRWKEFREVFPVVLFTMGDNDTKALNRLREMFGFQYLKDIPCSDGKSRRLYVHYGPTQEAQKE